VLKPFSTIFQFYRGGQFYWWKKPEHTEKTIDLPQVTDKLYHIHVVSITPRLSGVRVMVFNATFNNISVILLQSVLLVNETGVPGENNRPVASH
jgi:hypothetical protein